MRKTKEQKMEEELPLILTVAEVAKILRIGKNTTYKLIRCGKLRSLRIGRQLRVPRQAVLDFLEK